MGEGRRVKRLAEQAAYIGTLEPDFEKLTDDELRGKTAEFKQRLENGESLEDLIFEAYAAVREAFRRTIGVRLFDVQLMGGIVLHEGDIAEMKTGEGKTFVAVQPLYLNGLAGQGVHLVTVNDYLAKRDAEWTQPVYELLGSSVGAIQNLMPFAERREAYACDVVYGTNSEFGFDYLRDNMAVSLDGVVQRSHSYAIVDEVDSILVDEARTPLIISGEPETAAETYYQFARVAKDLDGAPATRKTAKGLDETELSGADFLYDEKFKTVSPAQATIEKVERALGIDNLYDPKNVILVNHLMQALKAQSLYKRDVDYVVQEGEVKIVDEFTGRIMEGRRWSEGLHQAIEAKEGTRIREENVTLASITLQNYFRLYERLAGMTGTAKTEEKEFVEIYDLHVVEIPTNQPVARLDENDYIFKTPEAKFSSVLDDIVERHEEGQPVLVGTIAVETSEFLSEMLKRKGIPHNVLNAKEHEREGEIIKDAGQRGAVTIATNMAGRGVDIKLGEGVVDLGGLYVLGTERHESRRIDNQLRGRSGRQGDPGETRFYLSGQDDLVRLFAGDRIYNIMNRFKIPDDQPMEASILSKQIENAQKKVEEQNFVARKNVLKYDDVMNTQRMVIYEQRRRVLEGEDEVRTPLIISGEPETAAETYYQFARVAKDLDGAPATRKTAKGLDETELSGADFLYDEKFKTVSPAQATIEKVERALGIDNLYDPKNVILVNHLMQALKAQSLYKRDVDYVVQEGEVKIVDEFTGPDHGRPPLERGAAPGDRGEGGHEDPRGERHARVDHAAELLPPVRAAGRHDRVPRRRRRRSSSRSTTCTSWRSRPTSPSPASTRTTTSSRRPRRSSPRCSTTSSSATRRASRCSSARSRSRPPSSSRRCSSARASRTTC